MNTKSAKAIRTKRTSKGNGVLLYAVLIIVTLYVLFMIVDQQMKINSAKSELALIDEQIFAQEQRNSELKKVSDAVKAGNTADFEAYVERIAREDLDYVKNGEVVFINIAGD